METQKKYALDTDLDEILKQLRPLIRSDDDFKSQEGRFLWRVSDNFASAILPRYALAKEQASPILQRTNELKEEIEKSKTVYEKEQLRAEYRKIRKEKAIISNPVFEAVSDLSMEDRLVVAYAMADQELARFSCYGGMISFKRPSGCHNCNEAERNATRAGVLSFYRPTGEDRVYGTDSDELSRIVTGAMSRIPDNELVAVLTSEFNELQQLRPDMELLNQLSEQRSRLELYVKEREEMIRDSVKSIQGEFREALRHVYNAQEPLKELTHRRI